MEDVKLNNLFVYRVVPNSHNINPFGGEITLDDNLKTIFIDSFAGTVSKGTKKQPFHFRFSDTRNNDTRELIIRILNGKKEEKNDFALKLAKKLSSCIDDRTGELLLTIGIGEVENNNYRCAVWAYPSDNPIQLNEQKGIPNIKEIKNAFSKSSSARKAAFFDTNKKIDRNDLLKGIIIDKTANRIQGSSDYWLDKFLEGKIELLSTRGTTILISTLKESYNKSNTSEEKQSVRALFSQLLSNNFPPKTLNEISRNLTGQAKEIFFKHIPKSIESDAVFEIDFSEVKSKIKSNIFILKSGIEIIFPFNESLDPEDYIKDKNGKKYITVEDEIEESYYK